MGLRGLMGLMVLICLLVFLSLCPSVSPSLRLSVSLSPRLFKQPGLRKPRQQPLAEDFGFARLARPARAVEHRHRHRQGVVLARPIASRFELSVITLDQLDALAR